MNKATRAMAPTMIPADLVLDLALNFMARQITRRQYGCKNFLGSTGKIVIKPAEYGARETIGNNRVQHIDNNADWNLYRVVPRIQRYHHRKVSFAVRRQNCIEKGNKKKRQVLQKCSS